MPPKQAGADGLSPVVSAKPTPMHISLGKVTASPVGLFQLQLVRIVSPACTMNGESTVHVVKTGLNCMSRAQVGSSCIISTAAVAARVM